MQDALEAAVPAYCASEDATEEGRNVLKEYQNAVSIKKHDLRKLKIYEEKMTTTKIYFLN